MPNWKSGLTEVNLTIVTALQSLLVEAGEGGLSFVTQKLVLIFPCQFDRWGEQLN